MATNPLGSGTRNITGNVSKETFLTISELAGTSGVTLAAYTRAILEHAAEKGLLVRENPEDKLRWLGAVARGESPLPKVRKEVAPLDQPVYEALKVAEELPAQHQTPPTRKRGRQK